MLKLPLKPARGFTLIEMMIGVALLAIIILMAVPNFSLWIRNLRIRTATESIQSGLTLARNEALKRNTAMRFQLTTSVEGDCALYGNDGGSNWAWVVRDNIVTDGLCVEEPPEEGKPPKIVQAYDGAQSGGDRLRITAGESLFRFNGLGRLTTDAADIDVTDTGGETDCASGGGEARCLRIEVTTGGIRMCDPALPSTDPQGCS